MTTAVTQDLIDPFTPRIEELLRERDAARAAERPVAVLICELFIYLMRMMAVIFERNRNGELPAPVPAGASDRPELNEPIAGAPCEMTPRAEPGVEQPAALRLPRRARVRKLKVSSGRRPRGRNMWIIGAGRYGAERAWFGLRKLGFWELIRRNRVAGRGFVRLFSYVLATIPENRQSGIPN